MPELLPDLRQLRAFVAVVDEGSFTQAAKKLSLTQSAISHSMRALEEGLGCRLLTRLGKKTVVTGEGEVFLGRCRRILGELELAGRELDGLRRWGQGRIRIGAPHSLCQFLLPTVLREFRDCFPRCEPSIEAGDTALLLERLKEHELDVVLGMRSGPKSGIASRSMFHDEMTFMVPPVHEWVERKVIPTGEVPTTQFIVYGRSTETHRLVEKHFHALGVSLRAPLVLGDMEAIKEMAKIGIGVGILAPWVAGRELDEGSLVALPVGEPPIRREWAVFWNEDRPLSLIEETFGGIAAMVGEGLGRQRFP